MSDLFPDTHTATKQPPRQMRSLPADGEFPIPLDLWVTDRDVISALLEYPEGDERNRYALEALKIGVLALRHVGGQATADLIQREVRGMQQSLEQHNKVVHGQLTATLQDYFDPKNGRFSHRVQGLVAQDGELAQLIKGFIDGENSQLARTLVAHVGSESLLMKQLDPRQSEGLLSVLKQTVDAQLCQQRDQVLKEFSLDNKEGSLARLVSELNFRHGDLTKDLRQKIDEVVKEFSLDKQDSALSRLVQNVDRAQRTITNEFSLDSDTSALSRLKRELHDLLAITEKKNQLFQEEVKISLARIVTTRQEADRSTRHGLVFQDAVCEFLAREAQHAGDIAIPTGHATGQIRNCKVGDCVIELGPDSAAPGSKIVIEAKEEAGVTLARAREEIEIARKNRGADWGLFVFSRKTAPSGLEPFQRYGSDLVVVWDAEDPANDVFLKAGVIAARALCFRAERRTESAKVDFDAIERAILEIEKRAGNLDEVRKSAETIQSASAKILERVRIDRDALDKQVTQLREKVGDLRNSMTVPQ
ncbi:MAG TPA: hypothetical protein VGM76_17275 [Lacipirellulaceae bacterium]|jgi:hypothetical protein